MRLGWVVAGLLTRKQLRQKPQTTGSIPPIVAPRRGAATPGAIMSHHNCVDDATLQVGTSRPRSLRLSRSIAMHGCDRIALLAGFTLIVAAAPAMAGCNSGSSGTLLTSPDCQASAAGSNATVVGYQAFGGSENQTIMGYRAGPPGSLGVGATNIGAHSGFSLGGNYSTAIGGSKSIANQSYAAGDYSIAIGSGDDVGGNGARTTNVFGIAVGTGSVATGVRSVAVGAFAGDNAGSTGNNRNSAFGTEAGRFVTGGGNTGVGLAAGHTVTGDFNSALGNSAGQAVTGNNNLSGGVLAGVTVKGSYNVAYGDNAGRGVTGNNNVAIGRGAGRTITAHNTVAIGAGARATATNAVAIGQSSLATVGNSVSVGSSTIKRRIMNVAPGVSGTDAVNVAQLQAAVAAVASGTALEAEAVPVAPEPSTVSIVATGNAGRTIDDLQRRLSELEALVRLQQQRISQLESRIVAAVK